MDPIHISLLLHLGNAFVWQSPTDLWGIGKQMVYLYCKPSDIPNWHEDWHFQFSWTNLWIWEAGELCQQSKVATGLQEEKGLHFSAMAFTLF